MDVIKSKVISFRTNEFERLALKRLALAERRKPADYLREMIRQEAQRRGLWKNAQREGVSGEN